MPANLQAFNVQCSRKVCTVGDTLHFKIDEFSKKRDYTVTLWDSVLPFYETGGVLECYAGVPFGTEPGAYTIEVHELKRGKENKRIDIHVEVSETSFPVDYLEFTPEKKSKITAADSMRERKFIDEAYAARTKRKYWTGDFDIPVKGRISGVFGATRRSAGEILWVHRGVDIAGGMGSAINAPAAGEVLLARNDFNMHGKTVIIDHGLGIVSIYIHLKDIYIKEGDRMERGQLIGHLGNSGLATGPHLHWGIYVNSVPVDPLKWLGENADTVNKN
ncbi:MAG: M23 family metallopeptidase [Elusimicrobiota bacterium]